MDVVWFLILSAFIFAIGAAGVMTRRNPLVVLLCLELMLNAGNLALIAFSRMHGNEAGQVFALIVMVIAACEVVIGAAGVMTRRNPLVVLLCLELMLNAGNLALVAFSRMHGSEDGQVFALIVMVIAACEVTIGLGIIVAMYRNRLPIDVDEMSELRG